MPLSLPLNRPRPVPLPLPRLLPLLLPLLLPPSATHAQDEIDQATLRYTPSESGYELEIPFRWKFIDCFGEAHLTITKVKDEAVASAYVHEGRRYTAAELGAEALADPDVGLTNLSADVYEGAGRLGRVELENVIDWLGGCFGQTYNVLKQLGLDPGEYGDDRRAALRLSNLSIDYLNSRDYGLEGRIRELLKREEADEAVARAGAARAAGDLDGAESAYREALGIDPSHEDARRALEETRSERAEAEAEAAYDAALEEGRERDGDLGAARDAYRRALRARPDDAAAESALAAVEERLERRATTARNREAAVSEASGRRHTGSFRSRNLDGDSEGTGTQAATLLGEFRVDYEMWALGGEAAHRFRFYWEWADFDHTGYPLWVSVLGDQVVRIAELARYPDLLDRWNALAPLYVEVESDILSWKHGDDFVADDGRIRIIPTIIGRAGQTVDFEPAASSNWDELFPYTNGLKWDYFERLGLNEELGEYTDRFGTDVGWPRYAFMYSDEIDFYFHGSDRTRSSSADVTRIVWPVDEVQAVVDEFERREQAREQARAEEGMSATEFWNTPESTDVAAAGDETDFWEAPEDATTVRQRGAQRRQAAAVEAMRQRDDVVGRWRQKYAALQDPFTITAPEPESTVESGQLTVKGRVHSFLAAQGVRAIVEVDDERTDARVSGGDFSAEVILSEGWNTVGVEADLGGFAAADSLRVFYEKPPPLPCDESTSAGSGRAIYEHGLGQERGSFLLTRDFFGAYDEMAIYPGPKERRHRVRPIYRTDGTGTGSDTVQFDIETGVITVVLNEGASGSAWRYTVHCP